MTSGSVAPKERVNIVYRPATDGAAEEVELPLKLLVLGEYGTDDVPIDETQPIQIDKNNFNDVLKAQNLSLNLSVPNQLDEASGPDDTLALQVRFESLDDFSPDALVEHIPELKQMIALRDALKALKGPLGNIPEFRATLQKLIADDEARQSLLAELGISH